MRIRVFPHESGRGWDVDLSGDPPPEALELGEPPFPTSGAARRAVRFLQRELSRASIVVLEERPDDAHERGGL